MKNLKTSMKLLWPHVVVLLLLAAGVIISIASFTSIRAQMKALHFRSFIDRDAADTINVTFETMQSSIFCAILNGSQDVIDEAITDTTNAMQVIEEQVALLKSNTLENISMISRLEEYLSRLEPMQEHVLNLMAQKKNAEAVAYMESSNIPVIQAAQKELAQFTQSAYATEMKLMDSLKQTQRNTVILLVSLGVAGILFSLGVGTHILRLQKKGRGDLPNSLQKA